MTHTIGVFELGPVPEEVEDRYPDYATMITNWLKPALPEMEYRSFSPVKGEPIPEPDACDGYLYSGSRYGVYDDVSWIAPLEEFVRQAAAMGKPQFGICFGHQIMAEAFGGKVVKSDRGWGCGIQEYRMDMNGNGSLESGLKVLVMHQDQIVVPPGNATLVGGNEFCRFGAYRYDVPMLSVQFHPEFNNDYMADLLRIRGGVTIPQALADAAKKTLDQQADSPAVAAWAAGFFREYLAA